ncbi:multiheme c-type cytochrome [Methanosalsum zhilinae]|nr:multiheme c-type cytochrome [Methanosalsum zhilinae]
MTNAGTPTQPSELSAEQFDRPGHCSTCHGVLHSQWSGSMHSYAQTDPFYLKEFEIASHDTDGLTDQYCAQCHTPVGVLTGEFEHRTLSEVSVRGVHCDFCHSVSGMVGVGNAPYIVTPGDTKWGSIQDPVETPAHESEYLELQTRSEICGGCHYVIHPTRDLVIDDTYLQWKNSTYAIEGTQCQDCHMTPGITQFQANPGRVTGNTPPREHVSIHYFVGANAFITDIMGSTTHRDRAIENLQHAATIDIHAPETARVTDTIIANISITNTGAGHTIPTGVADIREVWTTVRVIDREGNVIYSYGTVDENGDIDPGTYIYNIVWEDEDGEPTTYFWRAEGVLSDQRIPTEGTVYEEHIFEIPENVSFGLTVDARLNYRSASQEKIDYLFGEGTYEVPVITMTEKTHLIFSPDIPREEQIPDEPLPGIGFIAVAIIIGIAAYFRSNRNR